MRHRPRSQTAEGPPRSLRPLYPSRASLARSPPGTSILINLVNQSRLPAPLLHALFSVSVMHCQTISATITTILTSPLLPEMGTLRPWRDRGSDGDGCKSRSRTTTTSAWSAAAGYPSTGCPVSEMTVVIIRMYHIPGRYMHYYFSRAVAVNLSRHFNPRLLRPCIKTGR